MHLILIFLILCSGAISLSLIFNKKIEETISLWIFILIAFMYIFGILGLLKFGIYTVVLVSLMCALFCCYNIYKNKQNFISHVLTPGFAIFIIFFILIWWAQRGRMLTSWDEFSHWGLVVKNMYIFNALGNYPDATTMFKGYPPATSLFEYFWVKLSGNFSEGNLFRAMNILYFSLMLPIFKNIEWKHFGKIIIRTLFILILPLVFYKNFYICITVDAILGIMFAYILINYFTNELDTYTILSISFALFILSLTKSSGSALAFITVLIIAMDILFINRQDLKRYIGKGNSFKKFKRVVIVSYPLLFTVAAKYSWSLYLSITKTNESWNTSKVTLHGLTSIFDGSSLLYQKQTLINFFNFLSKSLLTDHILKISFIGWMLILIFISIIFIYFICKEDDQKCFKVATIVLFVGAGIYTLSLLVLYLFTYTEYEAVKLASCARYLDTYLLGILVFLIAMICLKDHENRVKSNLLTMFLILLLLLTTKLNPILDITFLAPSSIKSSISLRKVFEPITKIKQTTSNKNDKVYFISIADEGFDLMVSKYNMTPIKLNIGAWSIGKPYYKGDIWTKDIDVNKWSEQLKNGYTYVYIYRTNALFNKDYGKIFYGGSKSIQSDTLYYINKTKGTVVLEKVKLK